MSARQNFNFTADFEAAFPGVFAASFAEGIPGEFDRSFDRRRRSGRGPKGRGGPFDRSFDGPFDGRGGPRGGGPRGGGGRGRVRRGQIRTALLALLADEPMHGYEMIRTLDDRSEGRWKPSPGAVYPTLSQLADEGLVTSTDDAGKRVFSLTDDGRAAADALTDNDREPWRDAGGDVGFELRGLVQQLGHAVRGVALGGTAEQQQRAITILAETRRSLYALLAEDSVATDEPEGDEEPTDKGNS